MKRNTGNINRTDRLNGEFQKEIANIISRKLKNPLITEMVSITDVIVSKDLKHAKVFVSVYSTDSNKRETTYRAIIGDAKKIRYELAQCMRIRTVPELSFVLDESFEYGDKMDKLLNGIKKNENID